MSIEPSWVRQACELPSREQPQRIAEFDALFATSVRGQTRTDPTRLRLVLDSAAPQAARELTEREAECCSFFTFTFTFEPETDHRTVFLDVDVPEAQAAVLDALADRAAGVWESQ